MRRASKAFKAHRHLEMTAICLASSAVNQRELKVNVNQKTAKNYVCYNK